MSVQEYIPSYPFIEEESFYRDLTIKKEFLDDNDPIFFKHQKNIARFLSPKTLYDSILLIHEMGTGKTATAIASIMLIRKQDPEYKQVIILAGGKTQLQVFRDEIFKRVPEFTTKYASAKIEKNTILRREGFQFDTYRSFAKDIIGLSDVLLKNRYEKTIFVMDEVHNLTAGKALSKAIVGGGVTNTKAYNILYHLLHILKNRKLLCMTGTPIRDQPFEIARLLNMVLPISKKMEIGQAFQQKYFTITEKIMLLGDVEYPIYKWKPEMKNEFQNRIQGYASYIKRQLPNDLIVEYIQNKDLTVPLKYFKVYGHLMKDEQSKLYLENFIKDLEGESTESSSEVEEDDTTTSSSSLAYFRSKQASLFVFPNDGETIGKKVTELYIKYTQKVTDKSMLSGISWKPKMNQIFPKTLSITERIEKLKQYSIIYGFIVEMILKNPLELVYIYSFLKSGSGIYVLVSFLVQYFNFELITTVEQLRKKSNKKRVLVLNGDFFTDSQLKIVIDEFNSDNNMFGERVQVVIGTKQTKEGITLKNIRQTHIVQPEWNYSDISQALARGIRIGSHTALQEYYKGTQNIQVRIYQHVSVPMKLNDDGGFDNVPEYDNSVDVEQYKRSEIKDINIKLIERAILESSWDCSINQTRNTGKLDGSRECEYQSCSFQCKGIDPRLPNIIDKSTYNPYYSTAEQELIHDKIMELFHKKDIVDENTLYSIHENSVLVHFVLESKYLSSKTPVINRYGMKAYVWKDFSTNSFYLSEHPYQGNLSDFYVYQNHILPIPFSFEKIVSSIIEHRISYILNSWIQYFYKDIEKNGELCIQEITKLPLHIQEIIIETIISLVYKYDKDKNLFFDHVLNHYENQKRLVKQENYYISSILSNPRYFSLSTKIWSFEIGTTTESLQKDDEYEYTDEFINKYIHDNKYGYYGIVEIGKTETKFKIRDVRNKELVFGKNKAKIPKGELCGQSFSKKKDGLIAILFQLQYQGPISKVSLTVSDIQKLFTTKSALPIYKLFQKLVDTHLFEYKTFTNEQWKTLYILSKLKLPELCFIARQRFEELNLLYTKKV